MRVMNTREVGNNKGKGRKPYVGELAPTATSVAVLVPEASSMCSKVGTYFFLYKLLPKIPRPQYLIMNIVPSYRP